MDYNDRLLDNSSNGFGGGLSADAERTPSERPRKPPTRDVHLSGGQTAVLRLLLVDFQQHERERLAFQLQATTQRFDVVIAKDANEALAALLATEFDCILLDVNLPSLGAVRLVTAAWRRFGSQCPPVVFMTGAASSSTEGPIDDALGEGLIDKCQVKPAVLEKRLLAALDRHAVEQAKEQQSIASRTRAIGQVVAGLAQELESPVAQLRANLGAVAERFERALNGEAHNRSELGEQLRLISECVAGVQRMTTTTTDLQRFSRDEHVEVEPVSLDDVVSSSMRLLRPRLAGVEKAEVALSGTPLVMIERQRLVQAVVNLLSNALDAADPVRPVIRVTTRHSTQHAEIVVEDNGPGIPLHLRGKVLQTQASASSPARRLGGGLGLSPDFIVRVGGKLEIDGSPLGGALFRIRLPVTVRRDPTRERPTLSLQTSTGKRATVLAVDDEPNIRRAYARVLSARYHVYTAANGMEALEALKQHTVDAIVCDLAMPDMGGRALLSALQQTRPDLARRVIFCTGGELAGGFKNNTEEGNLVLSKPVSKFTLEDAIDDMLREVAGV